MGRFNTLLFVLIALLEGCSGSFKSSDTQNSSIFAGADQAARQPAGEVVDIKEAFAMHNALRGTKTNLTLSQSDFATLKHLLPESLRLLADGFVTPEQLASARINDGDLLRVTLVGPSLQIATPGHPTLDLAHTFALKGIVAPDNAYNFYRVELDGMMIEGKVVQYAYLLRNVSMQAGLEGGDEVAIPVTGALELISSTPDLSSITLPGAPLMVEGLFSWLYALTQSTGTNQLHLIGKQFDQQGQPAQDDQGHAIPNLDHPLRKMLRAQAIAMGLPADFLPAVDRVTDVWIDHDGIQVWLSEPTRLSFSQGDVIAGNYFTIKSSNPTTLVPASGFTVIAAGADGAELQQIHYVGNSETGRIDVDVYGYRHTILGTFGDTRTISFAL